MFIGSISRNIPCAALWQRRLVCCTILKLSIDSPLSCLSPSKMSTITRTAASVLQDYELHHSGDEENHNPVPEVQARPSSLTTSQPAHWPTDHRRIPPYRPTNRNLDLTQRPAGTNGGEFVFIQVMLHGVLLNSTVAHLWRRTGGRINDKIFHYKIGGEW